MATQSVFLQHDFKNNLEKRSFTIVLKIRLWVAQRFQRCD
jgi:hypothetical protein